MSIVTLHSSESVLDAARDRVRWLFSEFDVVMVSFSGGKDSTVCLNLALQVAEELGRGPVPVLFLDQEFEWQATIDYVRAVMDDPRVDGRWLQVPFLMNNATSVDNPWLTAWDPAKEADWMRPKEEDSVHENVYGTDNFYKLFPNYLSYHYPRKSVASLTGMRCEESPGRAFSLTGRDQYKGATWACQQHDRRKHYIFSPIYDWSYTDVWKAIQEGGGTGQAWRYCRLYDQMYQHGVPVHSMRVSSVTHEQATKSLFFMQEVEGHTWNQLTKRAGGINSVGQMKSSFYAPTTLPRAFKSWVEYRDYLMEHLTDDRGREYFGRQFPLLDKEYEGSTEQVLHGLVQAQISCILRNDWEEGQGLANFRMQVPSPRRQARIVKHREDEMAKWNAYLEEQEKTAPETTQDMLLGE